MSKIENLRNLSHQYQRIANGLHQKIHDELRVLDPDHDDSSCWCCCLDCEDLNKHDCPGRVG